MIYDIILISDKPWEEIACHVFNIRAAEPNVRVIVATNMHSGIAESTADKLAVIDESQPIEKGFAESLAKPRSEWEFDV